MRIGFDAKRAFNNNTGLGNYSRFIINALLKFAPENDYLAYTPKISNQSSVFSFQLKNKKSLKIKLPTTDYRLLTNFWRSRLIINDLGHDNIAIFHGLSNELPFGIRRSGIKSVVTIHDLIFLRFPELYPPIDRFFYKIKFKNACQQADVIIAVSEQTKRDIIDFYGISPEKIKVVYQDCDETFSQLLDNEAIMKTKAQYQIKKPYILSVGTITERKNQLSLVKAFEAMNKPDLDLILVGGRTKYQAKIEEYIKTRNLGNIQILNSVSFSDFPALYQGAEVFVYPSIFEGFGIPIVEALHSGVPVVAATGSCLEEAGGRGALYANPLNINELSEKINQILTNEELKTTLIEAGKIHKNKFSAEKIAQQLTTIYSDIFKEIAESNT